MMKSIVNSNKLCGFSLYQLLNMTSCTIKFIWKSPKTTQFMGVFQICIYSGLHISMSWLFDTDFISFSSWLDLHTFECGSIIFIHRRYKHQNEEVILIGDIFLTVKYHGVWKSSFYFSFTLTKFLATETKWHRMERRKLFTSWY